MASFYNPLLRLVRKIKKNTIVINQQYSIMMGGYVVVKQQSHKSLVFFARISEGLT
jgi:hypothetical protein